MEHTLSYSEKAAGWPSFYSFIPDIMAGMNGSFFSFKGGNLFEHGTNERRCNFYGVDAEASVSVSLNDGPVDNKLFKTIELDSNAPWGVGLESENGNIGTIDQGWFEQKENTQYAFIRTPMAASQSLNEYQLRSMNGIGSCLSMSSTVIYTGTTSMPAGSSVVDNAISFIDKGVEVGFMVQNRYTLEYAKVLEVNEHSLTLSASIFDWGLVGPGEVDNPYQIVSVKVSYSMLAPLGQVLSVGDLIYWNDPDAGETTFTPRLLGEVANIVVDIPNGLNYLTVYTAIIGAEAGPVGLVRYFMSMKNTVSESNGLLGHYCVCSLTNDSKTKVELFSVGSEIMKSYP